jgi:cation diffusion facilitator family transporter
MSTEGGNKAIVAALSANLGIAAAKFVGFLISGASSMLAEAVHSLADSGNQVLLLIGGKKAKKAATAEHPFGFGRERYVYAFMVSIILFSVGGVFAIYEGVHKLQHPEEVERAWLPITILLISLCLEGYSLRTALHESAEHRKGISILEFIRRAKSPELPVVLLEDMAALIGLALALIGVVVAVITGNGAWDGAGTVAIGVLLVLVAIVLGIEVKSLLVGEGASPEDATAISRAALAGHEIERIIHMKTLYLGPDELMVGMKVAVAATDSAQTVAGAIDAVEQRVREAVPAAKVIYIEPDIYRDSAPPVAAAARAVPDGSSA